MPPLFMTQGVSRTPVHWLGVNRHGLHTCPTTFDHVNQRPPCDRGPLRRGPRSRFVDSVPSEAGGVATASTMPLRALENQLGSSNCCTTEAVLLKTRGGNPQLLSCKVSHRSYYVRESCRRPNMEKSTAPTAVSSQYVPSEVQALTTRAASLGAHNPDCGSCMSDWLTGLHGGSLWSSDVSLDRGI